MSRAADSRDPNGLGFLILQDHEFKSQDIPEYARGGLCGMRVLGRNGGKDQFGDWNEDRFARGVIGGGHFWGRVKTNAGDWRFAWGAVTAEYGEDGYSTTDGKSYGDLTDEVSVGAKFDWYYNDGTPKWENIYADYKAGKVAGVTGDKMAYVANAVASKNIGAKPAVGIVGVGGNVNQIGLPPFQFNPFAGAVVNNALVPGAPLFGLGLAAGQVQFVFPGALDPGGNPVNVLANKKQQDKQNQDPGDAADNASKAWYGEFASETFIPTDVYPTTGIWVPDRRNKQLRSSNPIGWPTFPRGYFGIVLAASDNDQQVDQFYPADPRLIAANFQGPSTMGTPVADLRGDASLDLRRHSPLQSLVRVIKGPSGKEGMLGRNAEAETPRAWLARQIGPSGQWDVCGGLVCDIPTGKNGTISRESRILAMESVIYGGPLDVGHYGDAHQIGEDADGNPINSLHLSTKALFKVRGDVFRDFPLYFEEEYPEDPGELAFPLKVHLGPDFKDGLWKWWTTTAIKPMTPTITPRREPPPPSDPPPTETTPTPEEHEEPRVQPDRGANREAAVPAGAVQEIAFTSFAFRPHRMEEGIVDLRYSSYPRMDAVAEYERIAPLTARLEAFGAQGGSPGGPYLSGSSGFVYSQSPGYSRGLGGTAAGGLILLPPEVDMADIDSEFAPVGVDRSTTYLLIGPGAKLGVGIPELATGGLRDGYSIRENTGGITFAVHGGTGGATDVFSLDSSGKMDFHDHAGIQVGAGVVPQTGVTTIPEKFTAFNVNGESAGCTPNVGDDSITIAKAGTYLILFSCSFDGDANSNWDFILRINGSAQNEGAHGSIGTAGDEQDVSFNTLKTLAAGDVVTVYVNSEDAGGDDMTVSYATLSVIRIR